MKKKRSKRNKYNNRSKRITKKRKGILKKRKISNKKKRGGMDSVTVAIDPFVTGILEETKLTQYKENLKGVSRDDLFDIKTNTELKYFLVGKLLKPAHFIKFKNELKNHGWPDLGDTFTDFEKECIFLYCTWDSGPFNFKLRGINSDITTDEYWKVMTSLKYMGSDINDISESVKEGLKYKKWFEMVTNRQDVIQGVGGNWWMIGRDTGESGYLGRVLIKYNTTIDGIIEGISSAIKKSVVTKDVIIYRGFDIESIASFSRLDPAFKSFTTDIDVILEPESGYLNSNGCCVLRTILKKGTPAYYGESEKQYVLDKDTMFSEPRLVEHDGFYSMYDVDILESQ
jgi:hypothetical protein